MRALVLLAHGSADPDWRVPIDNILARVREALPGESVELAFLEHLEPSLRDTVHALHARSCRSIAIVPLLLSGGGNHLKRQIPALLADIHAELDDVDLVLHQRALADHPVVVNAIAKVCVHAFLDGTTTS